MKRNEARELAEREEAECARTARRPTDPLDAVVAEQAAAIHAGFAELLWFWAVEEEFTPQDDE